MTEGALLGVNLDRIPKAPHPRVRCSERIGRHR
jgi:hypothetical protein